MANNLIPCPIDGKNLDYDIFDAVFDDGEYMEHGNWYIGFFNGKPLMFYHKANTHTLEVRCGHTDALVEHIRNIINLTNEGMTDSDYKIIVKPYFYIRFFYQKQAA